MDLKKAAVLFKEIVERCPRLEGQNFLIMIPDVPPPLLTEGYEIIIKTDANGVDKETLQTLKGIAERENLQMEQMSTTVMMFTARPQIHAATQVSVQP